jgi:chromate transporter
MLIAVTWYRQTRTLIRGWLDGIAAGVGCIALLYAHSPIAYVVLLGGAFLAGWIAAPGEQGALNIAWQRGDRPLLAGLGFLLAVFAAPWPSPYDVRLIWLRLAGAGLTLFGGGFSALPVLKTLLVTSAMGIRENEFTLAFALSPIAPGPLLNVVPFFGYLTGLCPGALIATLALFAPSGCLVVLAQRHLRQVSSHPRFGRGMRVLRSVTTAFLAVAVLKLGSQVPWQPGYLVTAVFSLLCFATRKVPVYAVYGIVAFFCIGWMVFFGRTV